jgi:hypothetical protein
MTLFDKYSYKQKNLALLVLAVLLFAVAYKRSFRTTIETNAYIGELELKKTEAATSQSTIRSLQVEISTVNRLLGRENVSIERVQQGFLNFFALKSRGLSVQQIEEVYTFDHPDFSINTFRIDVKGDYLAQLRFIHVLEKEFDDARLIHTHFETRKDLVSGKSDLIAMLLLQNYVQNEKD